MVEIDRNNHVVWRAEFKQNVYDAPAAAPTVGRWSAGASGLTELDAEGQVIRTWSEFGGVSRLHRY